MKILGSFLACCTFALLGACGQETALPGAQIIGPADSETTYYNSSGFLTMSAGPVEFQVVGADGTTPSENVEIRFYGGLLTQELIRSDGTALNQADPLQFATTTDARGLPRAQVFALFRVPACNRNLIDPTQAGEDRTYGGTITASVGVASKTWRQNFLVKGCDPEP